MEFRFKLKKNIKRNYIFIVLQNMDLTRGIWMLYLASKGMSLTQLGLLETIFHITSFSMEVPTGAVADIFGRKISRICGRVLSLVNIIILVFASNFLWFAISFVFTALSYNLESGAGDALIYDSLKEINEEHKFMKINGNKEFFFQFASIISFFVGGYFANRSYNTAFVITIVLGIITLIQSMSFTEPSIGKADNTQENHKNNFSKQIKDSISVLINQPKISFLIIFGQIIAVFSTCIFYYLQNYLKSDGYNEIFIGSIYAISSLSIALVVSQVQYIEKYLKEKGILLIMPWITAIGMWGVALSSYHYIYYIILALTEGIIYVVFCDYINKLIPSRNRATILSFQSMCFSFLMIIIFPIVGLLGDLYSLKISFKCLALLGSLFVVINTYILTIKKNNNKRNKLKPINDFDS